MRTVIENCQFCQKATKQTAVVESWLDLSGYSIFIYYWRKCLECGCLVYERTKEVDCEDL